MINFSISVKNDANNKWEQADLSAFKTADALLDYALGLEDTNAVIEFVRDGVEAYFCGTDKLCAVYQGKGKRAMRIARAVQGLRGKSYVEGIVKVAGHPFVAAALDMFGGDVVAVREFQEERVSIMQYDGGVPEEEAKAYAGIN